MRLERPRVVNYGAFGKKVKAWAKGIDPLPKNIEEFKAQLDDADVGCQMPASYKTVKFVQGDAETLVIRLPERALLEDSEAHLAEPGSDYPVPALYERVFQTKPKIDDKQAFHAERVGDYTISMCG